MRFEYVVLLIIAFNVVTAVMKNRAKKKARMPESRGEAPVEAMPGLGRDILDQLARDLGLRRPPPVESAPDSGERPAPVYAGEVREAYSREREPQIDRVRERSVEPTPARRAATPVGDRHNARSEPARSRTGAGASPLRNSLLGKDRLREAFILKEILDPPLSRRARR